ncbi:fatty acid desaturase family protein [Niastella sp. OAS944]|uniref:fatty acid desaturase family protein n=1 Tax=Niastella sp. OAS944 TaxID=2664089 RepID=UPI003485EB8B|nr:linoleoyl-CoA desaturase [Chitinophagaceae bacterium OAS944]
MSKVVFNNKNAVFFQSLKGAIDSYFKEKNLKKTGNWALYSKTIILIAASIALYLIAISFSLPVVTTILIGSVLGFLSACIGFNVMHDANHGSYSSKSWVNDTLGLTLNALGGNSFIWRHKHNIIHHTYPNVDGIDDDIAKSPFIRMCSSQPWVPMHRIQHLYTPLLYAISSMVWILFQDFEKYFKQKVHNTELQKMKTKDHVIFWISKVLYVFFYIALPILLTGWQQWLVFFLSLHVGLGFTLAIVFQLAHVVEETEFTFAPLSETTVIENEWAIHQLKTTSNFSPDNKLVSWFAGGLNYQVEHHLFPRISHIHYPAISKIVKLKCEEFNVPYNCISSFNLAVRSHFRFIKLLGRKPVSA